LFALTPPGNQPSARLGDVVTLTGANLSGSNIQVLFAHPLLPAPVPATPSGGDDGTITVQVPPTPAALPAGFYTVTVALQRPGETFLRTTNAVSMALAPTVTLSPATAAAGAIIYTASVAPDVLPAQRASLLLGAAEILPDAHPTQTGALTFVAPDVASGKIWFRLRVDGVDSQLVDRSQTPPVFFPSQQVTVT